MSVYLYPFNKGEIQDLKFEVDLLIGEGFIDETHRLAQEHHIDHWYWWDRTKENNPENAENKSSNNLDDNGTDKNNKNGDSDKITVLVIQIARMKKVEGAKEKWNNYYF